jgi:hypothetical protein
VGAVAAVLTAAESLGCLASLVQRAGDSERASFGGQQISYYIPSTGEFPELLGVLSLLAVTTVLPAVAALVLWRAEGPVDAEPAAAPAPRGGVPAGPDVDTVDAEPEPEPEPVPAVAEVVDVPKLSAAELDAYRRPSPGELR